MQGPWLFCVSLWVRAHMAKAKTIAQIARNQHLPSRCSPPWGGGNVQAFVTMPVSMRAVFLC
jgi:hypothetical protein